mmetsp:Transcript_4346/g.8200  ORF Transcript_4346/g.8200 Transcript_4346/m.8200 type:complete len:239 (-) Transcript_4346:755-1471(-)
MEEGDPLHEGAAVETAHGADGSGQSCGRAVEVQAVHAHAPDAEDSLVVPSLAAEHQGLRHAQQGAERRAHHRRAHLQAFSALPGLYFTEDHASATDVQSLDADPHAGHAGNQHPHPAPGAACKKHAPYTQSDETAQARAQRYPASLQRKRRLGSLRRQPLKHLGPGGEGGDGVHHREAGALPIALGPEGPVMRGMVEEEAAKQGGGGTRNTGDPHQRCVFKCVAQPQRPRLPSATQGG